MWILESGCHFLQNKISIGFLLGLYWMNLQINLERIEILTILILPNHEHSLYLHLIKSLLISPCNVLKFLVYRTWTSFVRFIPKSYIYTIVDGLYCIYCVLILTSMY